MWVRQSLTTDTLLENVDALNFTYGVDTNDDGAMDDNMGCLHGGIRDRRESGGCPCGFNSKSRPNQSRC